MNNKGFSSIILLLLGALSIAGIGFGIRADLQTKEIARLGAFRPSSYTGKLLTRLNEGGAETTFKTSPGEGKDGTTLTTAKLGDFIVITLNPGASNEEKISVSAVSTTGSTTATWTIVNRGLSFTSNVQVADNIKQHAIGETVIISNDDHYLNQQYVNTDDAQTINGVKTFASTSQPIYDGSPTFTNARALIDKGYADGLAFQGVATSTEDTLGAVRLATATQGANGTASSSSGAPFVLTSRQAGNTYYAASSSIAVITGSTNKIDRNFIATTSTDNYNFGGLIGVGTSTPGNSARLGSQLGAYIAGTTTTSNLVVASSTISINGVSMTYPSAVGASSTVLMSNGTSAYLNIQPDWMLLGEQILGAANATSTVTFTGSHSDLMIVFDSPGANGSIQPRITFNTDYAGGSTTYSSRSFEDFNFLSSTNASNFANLNNNATTTATYFKMEINNNATRAKNGFWTMVNDTSVPNTHSGTIRWNNTTEQITTVNVVASSIAQTWNAGTRLSVYGKAN